MPDASSRTSELPTGGTGIWQAVFGVLDRPLLLALRQRHAAMRIVAVSEGFSIASGIAAANLIGRPVTAFLSIDESEGALERSVGFILDERRFLPARLFVLADGRAWLLRLDDGTAVGRSRPRPEAAARRATEAKLRETEKRVRDITDALPARIAYIDRDGIYRFANRAYERDFGLPSSDIEGMHARALLGDRIYEDIAAHIRAALSGRHVRYEYVHRTAERTVRNEVTYIPDIDRSGTVVGFYVLVNDVTARHASEQALRESQELLKAAERLAHVGSWSWDPATGGGDWSDERYRIFGYEPGAVVPSHRLFLAAVHPDDRSRVQRALAGALAGGASYDEQFRIVRPDGTIRLINDRGEVLRDADGSPRHMVGSVIDVTERKRNEDALFAEKERAEVTLHSIGDAVISTDAAGRIDYLNPVAERMTGWRLGDARGRPLFEVFRIVDEQTGEAAADPVARCLAAAAPVSPPRPICLVRQDRGEQAIEATAAPIRDPDGRAFGAVLVFRDVTENRRRTQQLAHDAAHDVLTGLANRREFERRLERAVGDARRHGWHHALCFLDLDQFKAVNDAAGHAAGDALLAQIRGLFAGNFRERDTFARLGGDEFGLLLDACALEEAVRIAEGVVATIGDFRFSWGDHRFRIGVSIGVVAIDSRSVDAWQVLSRADLACYAAKQAGGNRVHVDGRGGSDASAWTTSSPDPRRSYNGGTSPPIS